MRFEDLFDYIVPIIFFVVWIIGNVFNALRKKGQEPEEKEEDLLEMPRRRSDSTSPFDDFFQEDDIEEQIRQRRAEREKQVAEAQRSRPAPVKAPVFSEQPVREPSRPQAPQFDYMGELQKQKRAVAETSRKLTNLPPLPQGSTAHPQHRGLKGTGAQGSRLKQLVLGQEILGRPVALRK